MANTEEYIAIFKAETKQYENALKQMRGDLDQVIDKQGEQEKQTKKGGDALKEFEAVGASAFATLDKLTLGAAGSIRKMVTAIGAATGGMKLFKAALISTGIGALVVAIGSLVAYFTQTQRGADLVSRAMKGLSATVSVITDRMSAAGEQIVFFFKNFSVEKLKKIGQAIVDNILNRFRAFPLIFKAAGDAFQALADRDLGALKKAAKDAGQAFVQMQTGFSVEQQNSFIKGVQGLTKEIRDEANAAYELEAAMQRLKDREIELITVNAKLSRDARAARLAAEENADKRELAIQKLREAIDLEKQLAQNQIDVEKERERIIRAQVALGESSRDELRDAEEAGARVLQVEEARDQALLRLTARLRGLETAQNNANKAATAAAEAQTAALQASFEEAQDAPEDFEWITAEVEAEVEAYKAKKEIRDQEEKDIEAHLARLTEAQRVSAQDQADIDAATAAKRKEVITQSAAQILGVLASSTERRISLLEKEASEATGARKKELEGQIAIEKNRLAQLKGIQLAANFVNEAVAVGRAFAELGPIAGAAAAAALVVKFAALATQIEAQEFNEGTDYVKPANSSQGKRVDDIPAWLNKGEAVIPTKNNLKHRGLVSALVNGDVEGYIYRRYVLPELQSNALAGMSGMNITASLKDKNMVDAMKDVRRNQDKNFNKLIHAVKSNERSKNMI